MPPLTVNVFVIGNASDLTATLSALGLMPAAAPPGPAPAAPSRIEPAAPPRGAYERDMERTAYDLRVEAEFAEAQEVAARQWRTLEAVVAERRRARGAAREGGEGEREYYGDVLRRLEAAGRE